MNKKRLIVTSFISIILVVILMLGSTYSLFSFSEEKENLETNIYTTGNLDITYTLSDDTIKLEKSIPITEEQSLTIKPYRVTVTNNGNIPYMFDLKLNNTTATDEINNKYIMVKVGKIEAKSLDSCENNIIKEDIIIPAGESIDIDVKVYISDKVQNTEIGKSFFAKLKIDGLAIYDEFEEIDNDVLKGEYQGEVTITFNPNGGTVLENKKTVITTLPYGELPIPTRTDIVTFETNGGSDVNFVNSLVKTSEKSFLNELNKPIVGLLNDTPNIIRIDYEFLGWYLDQSYTQKITSETIVDLSTNATLYAKWSGENIITLPSTNRINYRFDGWYSDTNYQNKLGDPGDSYTIDGSIAFYGKWTRTHFTLNYNNNGGTGCGSEHILLTETTYGELCTPTRIGYEFLGWYTASSGGTQITSTTSIPENENHIIYASWTPTNYTISYTLNGGTISNQPTSYNIESNAFILPEPTKTGYTFTGWTGSNGTTQQTSVTVSTGTTGNLSYIANWTPTNYTITYNLNGGTISNQPTSYNIESNAFTLPEPTRTGYTFTGWTGSNGTTQQTSVIVSTGTTGNLTYTANWTANTYTITYIDNGGTGGPGTQNFIFNSGATISTTKPTKTGYNFSHWTYNGTNFSPGAAIPEGWGSFTLTANWTRNFTCAAAGSNTTYAGKTWTTISNSGGVCELALNTVSTTSGSYSNATTNLTNEYFDSGTLKTEKDAGLVTLIDSASGTSTGNKPAGIYWVASGSVYDSTTRYSYTCSNTTTYSGVTARVADSTAYPHAETACTTANYTALGSNNIHSNAVANSTITYTNSVATASSSRHASLYVTSIKPESGTSSAIKISYTRQDASGNYTGTHPSGSYSRSRINFYLCGRVVSGYGITLENNSLHGYLIPKSSTAYIHNYTVYEQAGLSNANQQYNYTTIRYYHAAGVEEIDGSSGSVENLNFGTNPSCKNYTTYTITSQSLSVYYRLHIKVKI